jgi:poly [ADP-ribose] polymerase 2/3/4
VGVKGVGRKTTDESEHFSWRDGVKVPCGKLVPSANMASPLEYNEYAVYDPKQVRAMGRRGLSRARRCCGPS